jgi:hypothetical protein
VGSLAHDLVDENLGSLEEWFDRQNFYSTKDARYELETERDRVSIRELFAADPALRRSALKSLAARLPGRALAYFLYSYVLRGGFLDGRDGLVFCTMRAMYQHMVAVKKYDLRRNRLRG